MADSILRLKVESQEYDQKIKRAAEGIQKYAQKCRDAGGTLQYLDDGVLEFVQSLGKMDTVATGTKQQLREMSNALTTLTQTYRGLTDEEKASPFGQELAKGIQQLTERAGEAKDAMMDVEMSIRNAASDTRMFDQMAQGMSVATAGFQGLTGAGKLLGIEMGNDVEVIAKLQAAMAVTNSLTTIQTALQKQSAFMQGVNAAKTALATAAQQAYAVVTGEATAAQVALNAAMAINPYTWVVVAVGAAITEVYLFIDAINKTIDAGEDFGKVIKNSMISPLYAYLVACNDVEAKEKRWHESLKDTKKIVDELAQSFNILRDSMKLSGASDSQLYDAEYESLQKKKDELRKQLGNKDLPHDEWLKISAQIKEVSKAMSELNQKRKTYLDMVAKLKDKSYVDSLSTEREINAAMDIAKRERGQSQMGSENWNYWNDLDENLKKRLPNATTTVTKPTTTDTGGKGDRGEKELTIQQQISELEKHAIAATEEERVAISEKIRALDEELARRKKIVEELHKIPEEKELTIQQQIAALEKEALTSADASREKIAEKIRLLDAELDRRKKIVEELHKIPEEKELTPYEQMKQSVAASIDKQNASVDTATLKNLMQVAIQSGIDGVDADFSSLFKQIGEGQNISDETWQKLVDTINEKLAEMQLDPIQIDFKTGGLKKVEDEAKKTGVSFNMAANAASQLGTAMASIEDPAAKAAGTVLQSIASIALGFAQASVQASSLGPFGWLAFLGAGVAAMATTINTVHTLTGFANGGIVPGNSFSGDNLHTADYGINSGELILSKSQQNNLASQLSEGGGGSEMQPYIDGEKLYLGMQAYTKRSGLGEIVTSNT